MSLILNDDNPLATKVTTRDGRPARIICIDVKNIQPILALVTNKDGFEQTIQYELNGKYYFHNNVLNDLDLINIVEKQKWWANVYSNIIVGYKSKEEANINARSNLLCCVEVEL